MQSHLARSEGTIPLQDIEFRILWMQSRVGPNQPDARTIPMRSKR